MPVYRRLPVEVKAVQWTGHNIDEIKSIVVDASHTVGEPVVISDGVLVVFTPGNVRFVNPGHWVVRDFVKNEIYACDPCIFEKTHELVITGSVSC